MSLIVAVVTIVLLVLPSKMPAYDAPTPSRVQSSPLSDRDSALRSLRGIRLLVVGPRPSDLRQLSRDTATAMSTETLEAAAALQLDRAGVPLLKSTDTAVQEGTAPYFYVRVDIEVLQEQCAYHITLELSELVSLTRAPSPMVRATTWTPTNTLTFGVAPAQVAGTHIRAAVSAKIAEFIRSYQQANKP